jgi:polyvinyl alcohol dehydrogenase (cytochrome)
VVAQGSLDGWLRIFDTHTNKMVFSYDTLREYEGVHGVAGQGGALDSAGIVAANGTLYVNSGYGKFGQPAGSVLLAFKPGPTPKKIMIRD